MTEPHIYDDDLLVRYLLGQAPEDETERCDELSIADDDFAAQLAAVENDLIDGYVRRQLSEDNLAHFESTLRASPSIRKKVEFARQFLQVADSRSYQPPAASVRENPRFEHRRPWLWALACAAAVVLIAVSAFLGAGNLELRKQIEQGRRDRAALELRVHELEALADKSLSAAAPAEPSIVSFLLRPQMRGAGGVPHVAIPRATEQVVFHLELEADDFPEYVAVLNAPPGGTTMWRSGKLKVSSMPRRRIVSFALPADLLTSGNFTLELSGVNPGAAPEFIGSYPFHPVLK